MLEVLKREIVPHAQEYCSEKWDDIFNSMQEIFRINTKAYKEGILSLEELLYEDYSSMDQDDLVEDDINATVAEKNIFKKVLRMIIDGIEGKTIEDFVAAAFLANNLQGLDAYITLIKICGLLKVQAGASATELLVMFQSFVPASYYPHIYDEAKREADEKFREESARRAELIKNGEFEQAFDFKTKKDLFTKLICGLNDKGIQKLLSEIGNTDLAYALKYTTSECIKKLCANMSEQKSSMLCDDMIFMGKVTESESLDAKMKIIAALNKLVETNFAD